MEDNDKDANNNKDNNNNKDDNDDKGISALGLDRDMVFCEAIKGIKGISLMMMMRRTTRWRTTTRMTTTTTRTTTMTRVSQLLD